MSEQFSTTWPSFLISKGRPVPFSSLRIASTSNAMRYSGVLNLQQPCGGAAEDEVALARREIQRVQILHRTQIAHVETVIAPQHDAVGADLGNEELHHI